MKAAEASVYSVMLVDDEAVLRSGMRNFIPWRELGFQVAAEAENGAKALERILQGDIDVVFLDIKMPHMSGIDLLEELARRETEVIPVVLSGYDNFEYARAAVKYKAAEYLLKPVDMDEVIPLLKTIRGKLEQRARQAAEQDSVKRQILEAGLLKLAGGLGIGPGDAGVDGFAGHFAGCKLRIAAIAGRDPRTSGYKTKAESWLNAVLRAEMTVSVEVRGLGLLLASAAGAFPGASSSVAAALSADEPPAAAGANTENPAHGARAEKPSASASDPKCSAAQVSAFAAGSCFSAAPPSAAAELSPAAAAADAQQHSALHAEEWSESFMREVGTAAEAIVLGPALSAEEWIEYVRAAMESGYMERQVFYAAPGKIALLEHPQPREPESAPLEPDPALRAGVKEGIRRNDLQRIREPLSALYFQLQAAGLHKPAHVRGIYARLVDEAADDSGASSGRLSLPRERPAQQDPSQEREPLTLLALHRYTIKVLEEMADRLAAAANVKTRRIVLEMQQYVSGHLADPVTLAHFAERYAMSQEYLSMLFKKEAGINFYAYLREARMKRAMELMEADCTVKIYELAHRVGYSDPRHFSKVFKEATGMTPKQYAESR